MTKEEELDWLYRLKSEICVCMPKEWKNMSNALNMAIKELQQEHCEDAVSRKAVLDMATVIKTDDYSGNEIMKVVDTDDIKALPSVTLAPKKEKWIDTDVTLLNRQGCLVHEVICSECNGISYFRKMGNKYIGANLCPNCGAKMESEL